MLIDDNRFSKDFFRQDVLEVAPGLIGQLIVRISENGVFSYTITEVEAYRGEEDEACHARFGMTARNSIMYRQGGLLYVYLIYGIHWMLNIVTGEEGSPQAVLIRGIGGFEGPGKLTRELGINGSHNGLDITESAVMWIEKKVSCNKYTTKPRIGIDYAGEPWKSIPWRFIIK